MVGIRKSYLDYIRVLAIMMVLYQHRSTYILADRVYGNLIVDLFLQTMALLCRCGVPLFFMVSGTLLLKKSEPISYVFKNRVVRILIVMLMCTAIVAFPNYTFSNIIDVFFTRLNWYLYAYLDYLLMLPFLRSMVQGLNNSAKLYFLFSVMLFSTFGGIAIFTGYYTSLIDFAPLFNSQFASISWSIIYAVCGYVLNDFLEKNMISCKVRCAILLIACVMVIVGAILSVYDISARDAAQYDQVRLHFSVISTWVIYIECYQLGKLTSATIFACLERIAAFLSSMTFGIFIIETHSQMIAITNKLAFSFDVGAYLQGLIAIFIQFVLCTLITYFFKMIPFMKKVL